MGEVMTNANGSPLIKLNQTNYFSDKAQQDYWSVSQFKSFKECEAKAMAEINGEYVRPESKALMMGSYVDAYFSGTQDEFVDEHPEIFNKRTGELKADYKLADTCIARAEADPMFMSFMGGDLQVIMTGELFGVPWKVKIDSLHDDKIVDLKLMRNTDSVYKDGEWKPFVDAWGYDIQGFIYQQIVKANTGKELPFYLAVITKEDTPDIDLIHIPNWRLKSSGEMVKYYIQRFDKVKSGQEAPERCGHCNYCRATKRITRVTEYEELFD